MSNPVNPNADQNGGFPSQIANEEGWLASLAAGRLTPKGRQVVHYIGTNPRRASFSSAHEIAEGAEVNTATVVRLAQALGFKGWKEFQLHFRHRYLESLLPVELSRDHRNQSDRSPVEAAIRNDIHNLQVLLHSDWSVAESVAQLVADSRKTLVISSGSYSNVAEVFCHLADFMGYNVILETRGGPHLVTSLANLLPGDCLLAVGFWNPNKQIVLTTQHCNKRGITTVAITDSVFSPLAQAAGHVLVVPTESTSVFQSSTAALSLVYGLLACLYRLGGKRAEQTILGVQGLYKELDILYTSVSSSGGGGHQDSP